MHAESAWRPEVRVRSLYRAGGVSHESPLNLVDGIARVREFLPIRKSESRVDRAPG